MMFMSEATTNWDPSELPPAGEGLEPDRLKDLIPKPIDHTLDQAQFPRPEQITSVNFQGYKWEPRQTEEAAQEAVLEYAREPFRYHTQKSVGFPKMSLGERSKQFAHEQLRRVKRIGKAAGILAIGVGSLILVDGGFSSTNTAQETTPTIAPRIEPAPVIAPIVPEAKPAVAITKSLPNLSRAAESTPQVLTLRVTEEDNSLWKAADSALSILPQYQDIPVPDKAIADAVHAAIYLKTAPQNPDRVFPGDEILTVATN